MALVLYLSARVACVHAFSTGTSKASGVGSLATVTRIIERDLDVHKNSWRIDIRNVFRPGTSGTLRVDGRFLLLLHSLEDTNEPVRRNIHVEIQTH
jgi:hypothetical protein